MTRTLRYVLSITASAVALSVPAQATAATQFGELFPADNLCGPMVPSEPGVLFLQTTSPSNQYAAPSSGVITTWSYQGGAGPPDLKLKVARPLGSNSFEIIGESSYRIPAPSIVNTYADVRIPVQAGDVIGFAVRANGNCGRSVTGYGTSNGTDASPGTTSTLTPVPSFQLSLSASLEPDCDSDGFGDETQDASADCIAPETQITKGPKDKSRKKQATFEFSSSEAAATFECSLDGGPFGACTSPDVLKVKRGRHHFEVRAKDAADNIDGSPAIDDWKVKKKRRK